MYNIVIIFFAEMIIFILRFIMLLVRKYRLNKNIKKCKIIKLGNDVNCWF